MKFEFGRWHSRITDLIAVLIPLIICFLLTIPLFGWIIDDAGISFAYAKNFAARDGLVSQPGVEPVEGYSNPLWIFVLTPFFILKIFHPFIVPKILSIILVGVTFLFVHKTIQLLTGTKFLLSLSALLLLATNASFVIWTCSGLENPLLACLVAGLVYTIVASYEEQSFTPLQSAGAGFIAGAIALTRPDGILYVSVFPLALLLKLFPLGHNQLINSLKQFGIYTGGFTLLFGPYLLFRGIYFGQIYPNTYFAKGGPTFEVIVNALSLQPFYLSKLQEIFSSLFGNWLWTIIPITAAIWIVSLVPRKTSLKKELILALAVFIPLSTYLILINDWMGEYRLATPFFPMLFAFMGVVLWNAVSLVKITEVTKFTIVAAVMLALLAVSIPNHYSRLTTFSDELPASFAGISERFGFEFNAIADSLGVENGSFLVTDIGGPLYYSKLRIYDLAGLCDPTIARYLRNDRESFLNYIFEEIKPTFIHTHGWFTTMTRFDEDPRFARDYVALYEFEDKYAGERLKRKVMSGNYVRKDAKETSNKE